MAGKYGKSQDGEPVSFPDGIDFGDETLSSYDEGTFSQTSAGASGNITGGGLTTTGLYYRRIGNIVFCTIQSISGTGPFNVGSAGNPTFFRLTGITGLPSFTSKIAMAGSGEMIIGSTYIPAIVLADTLGSDNIQIQASTTATGTLTLGALSFYYLL